MTDADLIRLAKSLAECTEVSKPMANAASIVAFELCACLAKFPMGQEIAAGRCSTVTGRAELLDILAFDLETLRHLAMLEAA